MQNVCNSDLTIAAGLRMVADAIDPPPMVQAMQDVAKTLCLPVLDSNRFGRCAGICGEAYASPTLTHVWPRTVLNWKHDVDQIAAVCVGDGCERPLRCGFILSAGTQPEHQGGTSVMSTGEL